ncbi:hypothetical protein PN480_18905 [Dolichospermum circinale CS-1225]|uniref:Uncharacterized protein n=1 Tax=Dolichospermum circinale CS-537/01 TaxID=3021739 RepID=A0ABT5A2K4_9CYAN|nr:hypothetical protein [Dolichospermum circinale]MDB9486134.1 hypothetical protein [Dolichospermum circinale CS-537/01]MDB9523998.1 hypothetical protein [Dolichospermum circinale CS-1225]
MENGDIRFQIIDVIIEETTIFNPTTVQALTYLRVFQKDSIKSLIEAQEAVYKEMMKSVESRKEKRKSINNLGMNSLS